MIAGCGADLLINICLTVLGYVDLLILSSVRDVPYHHHHPPIPFPSPSSPSAIPYNTPLTPTLLPLQLLPWPFACLLSRVRLFRAPLTVPRRFYGGAEACAGGL